MKGEFLIDGLVNDFNTGKFMQHEKLQVNITNDKIGCTVSIGSEKHGLQFSIPFDYFLKELKKQR